MQVLHLLPENGLFSCDRPLAGLLPLRQPGHGKQPGGLTQP